MTIDEKIKQAAEKASLFCRCKGVICHGCETTIKFSFVHGANFLKSEMLADMQKLAEALEFYEKKDEKILEFQRFYEDDCDDENNYATNGYFPPRPSDEEVTEYLSLCGDSGKIANKALAEFNAKYKGEK